MAKEVFQRTKLTLEEAYPKKEKALNDSGLMKDFLDVLFEELKDYFYL